MHIFTLLLLAAVVYLIFRSQQSKKPVIKDFNDHSLFEIKEAIMKIADDLDSVKKDVAKLKQSQSKNNISDINK